MNLDLGTENLSRGDGIKFVYERKIVLLNPLVDVLEREMKL